MERDKVLALYKAGGFHGRAKRNNKDLNNIRTSVCNAITRALAVIKRYEPSAADHLRKTITKGFTAVYQPPQHVPWSS